MSWAFPQLGGRLSGVSILSRAGFLGLCDQCSHIGPHTQTEPVVGLCFVVIVMKCLIFESGASFHFTLVPTNYVAGPD